MIENRRLRFERHALEPCRHPGAAIEERLGPNVLRWYVAHADDEALIVEATFYDGARRRPVANKQRSWGRAAALSIIPTGVGCEIGGYAGDAAPVTQLLASAVDVLITNPNALNASDFIALDPNVLYAEGSCIDQFCRGRVDLHVPYTNRVGVIIERTSPQQLDMVFNVINAVRAVHGVDVVACIVTKGPVGSRCVLNESGAYTGTIDRPEALLEAGRQLVDAGAEAIAVTTNIQDLPHNAYVDHFEGRRPNPMGGVEAIISHLMVASFGIPVAHAPALNLKELALADPVVDARGAGEMVSASGLACVLQGLARAPRLDPDRGPFKEVISGRDLLAVVAPAGCLGGVPVIHAMQRGIPVIAVEQNAAVIDVSAERLGLSGVLSAQSYLEAAGLLLALRRGLAPASLRRPLQTLRPQRASSE